MEKLMYKLDTSVLESLSCPLNPFPSDFECPQHLRIVRTISHLLTIFGDTK